MTTFFSTSNHKAWSPLRLRPRLFLHAATEAARRGLVPGRTAEDRFASGGSNVNLSTRTLETGQQWVAWAGNIQATTNSEAVNSGTFDPRAYVFQASIKNGAFRCDIREDTTSTVRRGLIMRGVDANNYLTVDLAGDLSKLELGKLDAGVKSVLTDVALTADATVFHRFRVECNEAQIDVYRDGTLMVSYTLTSGDLTKYNASDATFWGLHSYNNTGTSGRWDNLRLDALNSTATLDQFNDATTNANHALQSTAAKRPMLLHDGTRWVVRSDGVDDIMAGSAPGSSTAGGIVVAMAGLASVGSGQTAWLAAADEASTTRYLRFGRNTALIQNDQRNADTADTMDSDATLVVSTPFIAGLFSSGTAYTSEKNGVAGTLTPTSGSNTGDWFGDITGLDNYTILGRKTSSQTSFESCDICTVLVTDEQLTASEKARLYRWLNRNNVMGL
jgi:hypothetical protein